MADYQFGVVVLGAGAAGLAAARRLSAANLHVVVLEARDRIGGRIDTIHDAKWPVPIERGAEFIHGTSRGIWDLLDAASLDTYEIDDSHWFEPARQHSNLWQEVDAIFEQLGSLGREDLSFAEFLDRYAGQASAQARRMATAYVEGFDAADQARISAQSLLEDQRAAQEIAADRSFRLRGGYDLLPGWLAAHCWPSTEFHFHRQVREIRWEPGSVEVIARSLASSATVSYRASRVVVALPLGVLQQPRDDSGAVVFAPRLDTKDRAMSQLVMGPVVKVLLRFQAPFWIGSHLEHHTFWHWPEQPVPTWWTHRPIPAPVLTGWAAGPAASQLLLHDAQSVLDRALDSLAAITRLSRSRLDDELQSSHVANWQADPLARGAYSYVQVGGSGARRALAEPVADTLFFAGEATEGGLSGTVTAAIASGNRSADEILHCLRLPAA